MGMKGASSEGRSEESEARPFYKTRSGVGGAVELEGDV